MASEWNSYGIQDLIDQEKLVIGDGYRAKNEELSKEGLPFARAGNINNGFHFDNADHFPLRNLAKIGNKLSRAGDVVFTSKGTVGRFAYVRTDTQQFVYSPQLCFWRSIDEEFIDPRFLYFWMFGREFYVQYKGVAGQTDMAEYVSLTDQRRMNISLPNIDEQREISRVLGAIDDRIELNRKMNETLETMARALFKSWFVDFDPVRAKAEGRPTGLPDSIAALFPDSFEDTEFGEVPSGWKPVPLPELIAVNPSRSLSKGAIAPYLDMANMPTAGHSPVEVIDRPYGSGMRFMNGDTLVARITPCLENGKTAFVDILNDGQIGWGSTEYIVLRPKSPLPEEFAYFLARSKDFRKFAIQSMTGSSGRQRVPADSLSHFMIAKPDKDVAKLFGRLVKPHFERAREAASEIRTLAHLRDALLPKLISGEIRLSANAVEAPE